MSVGELDGGSNTNALLNGVVYLAVFMRLFA